MGEEEGGIVNKQSGEGEGGGKLEPAHPNKLFVPPSAVWLWAGLNHGMGTISIPMELLKKTSELRVMI